VVSRLQPPGPEVLRPAEVAESGADGHREPAEAVGVELRAESAEGGAAAVAAIYGRE
jgi:hypothetical protein